MEERKSSTFSEIKGGLGKREDAILGMVESHSCKSRSRRCNPTINCIGDHKIRHQIINIFRTALPCRSSLLHRPGVLSSYHGRRLAIVVAWAIPISVNVSPRNRTLCFPTNLKAENGSAMASQFNLRGKTPDFSGDRIRIAAARPLQQAPILF